MTTHVTVLSSLWGWQATGNHSAWPQLTKKYSMQHPHNDVCGFFSSYYIHVLIVTKYTRMQTLWWPNRLKSGSGLCTTLSVWILYHISATMTQTMTIPNQTSLLQACNSLDQKAGHKLFLFQKWDSHSLTRKIKHHWTTLLYKLQP